MAMDLTETTVRSYLKAYAEGGLVALARFESGGSVCAMDAYTDSIKADFENGLRPPSPKPGRASRN